MQTILCDCNEKTHLDTWGHRWGLAAPDSPCRKVHLVLPSHRPSPRHLEVGHGARLPQRRHTVHTGHFKHLLPNDFFCDGAVLLRGCVWLCERGCSLAEVSGRLQHWTLWGGFQDVPSVSVAHRLSCSSAHGVPQDHRLNPCLLHWLADSSPPGKPHIVALYKMMYS